MSNVKLSELVEKARLDLSRDAEVLLRLVAAAKLTSDCCSVERVWVSWEQLFELRFQIVVLELFDLGLMEIGLKPNGADAEVRFTKRGLEEAKYQEAILMLENEA